MKWSITRLAQEAGVDRSRLHKWLNKKVAPPNGATIEKLLKALGFKSVTFEKLE